MHNREDDCSDRIVSDRVIVSCSGEWYGVALLQQMQAKREAAEAAAAAAAQNIDDDDDDDLLDGGPGDTGAPAALCSRLVKHGRCGEKGRGALAAARSSPSGDSFATLATENHLDKSFVPADSSRLELHGLHDQLSVT